MAKGIKKIVVGPTFGDRVVALARSIPEGKVSTYGAIARAAGGGPMASRSVTGILAKAWNTGITDIPWHRIVYANGRVWLDEAHRDVRIKLYKKEGIVLNEKGNIENFWDILHEFN